MAPGAYGRVASGPGSTANGRATVPAVRASPPATGGRGAAPRCVWASPPATGGRGARPRLSGIRARARARQLNAGAGATQRGCGDLATAAPALVWSSAGGPPVARARGPGAGPSLGARPAAFRRARPRHGWPSPVARATVARRHADSASQRSPCAGAATAKRGQAASARAQARSRADTRPQRAQVQPRRAMLDLHGLN